MNQKAVFEIGKILHVKYSLFPPKTLTTEEIIETYEYKKFKELHPELCRLAEG